MITKSELQKANDEWNAERRRELGDPPTTEQLLAYSRGELPEAEEARVRELLVAYPDLARAVAEPFPKEGAAAGDDDYLSDAEFAAHWVALEKRLNVEDDSGRLLRFQRRLSFALAAMLVLAFGGMLWEQQANRRMSRELALPRAAWQKRELLPDGRRGGDDGSPVLAASGDGTMLVLPLIGQDPFPRYRGEIVDATKNGPAPLWGDALQRQPNDTFEILVPRGFLASGGTYRIVLYGVDGSREERLASYTVRVR
jgi:hypothetical protein